MIILLFQIASVLPPGHRERVSDLCHQIESDVFDLTQLCGGGGARGGPEADPARAARLAQAAAEKLARLKEAIRTALVDRVVEDFMDSSSPLKHFTNAVISPAEDQVRDSHIFLNPESLLNFFRTKGTRTLKTLPRNCYRRRRGMIKAKHLRYGS